MAPGIRCTHCGSRLDEGALMHGGELCTGCALAARRSHLPDLGEPDPDALRYINRVWSEIPDDAAFRRYGAAPANLKELIRDEAEAIRRQAGFRSTILRAVERATGVPFERPAVLYPEKVIA